MTRLPGRPAVPEKRVAQIVKQIYATGSNRKRKGNEGGEGPKARRKKSLEQVLGEISFWYRKQ